MDCGIEHAGPDQLCWESGRNTVMTAAGRSVENAAEVGQRRVPAAGSSDVVLGLCLYLLVKIFKKIYL